MKAQDLQKSDPEMKEAVWVTGEELPNPKIEKASDVIVKIGAAGVCRTDLHIIEGVWKHITDQNNLMHSILLSIDSPTRGYLFLSLQHIPCLLLLGWYRRNVDLQERYIVLLN